jgi:hypothetical protein
MRTLTLTSPLTRGDDVERAQTILKNHGYWVGEIDGVFGEMTGRACSQAKYELGYKATNIKPSYGAMLEGYLSGKKRRTPAMVVRANRRMKKKPLGREAARIARSFVGVKENPPNSNRVMFSEWYGMIGPWCAMFVTYCFVQAGSKAFKRGSKWAYCPFMLADAREQRGITVVTTGINQGDIALFDWAGDGVADHVGIVLTPPDNAGNFQCCEGNTAGPGGSQSDGGQVMIRVRNKAQVIGFVRVVE